MDAKINLSLSHSTYNSDNSQGNPHLHEFNSSFNNLNSILLSPISKPKSRKLNQNNAFPKLVPKRFNFASTSVSFEAQEKPKLNQNNVFSKLVPKRFNFASSSVSIEAQIEHQEKPKSQNWLKPVSRNSPKVQALLKNLSVLERAVIGAGAGGIAGAFTYVCLLPLDFIKTKLQTRGASEIYNGAIDAFVKTFKNKGFSGFYRGVSAVIVGSTASSAVYFGTCEFGKSILSKIEDFPVVLIPPTAGAMGNIVSSAIMVPKELITQQMQAGAKGRSWEVMLRILEKDGILGLYAGYSATLLRNLPAGVLSYSSFEYLKAAVLSRAKQANLEGYQSVCCGALAGAISASLTTPLDVVKTRLMTQIHGEVESKVSAAMYSGVRATVKQILVEEGWVGFTRGMGPRVLHSACFSAIGYFAFETARLTILNEYIRRKELQTVTMLDIEDSSNQSGGG